MASPSPLGVADEEDVWADLGGPIPTPQLADGPPPPAVAAEAEADVWADLGGPLPVQPQPEPRGEPDPRWRSGPWPFKVIKIDNVVLWDYQTRLYLPLQVQSPPLPPPWPPHEGVAALTVPPPPLLAPPLPGTPPAPPPGPPMADHYPAPPPWLLAALTEPRSSGAIAFAAAMLAAGHLSGRANADAANSAASQLPASPLQPPASPLQPWYFNPQLVQLHIQNIRQSERGYLPHSLSQHAAAAAATRSTSPPQQAQAVHPHG